MPSRPSEAATFSRRRGMPTPLSLTYSIRRPRLVCTDGNGDAARVRVANGVGQRFFENAKGGRRDLGIDSVRDTSGDRHRDAGNRRHAPRFVFDRAAKVAVIQPRRTQAGGDAAHHRDAEVDLPDGRLQSVDDVARRFQLAQTRTVATKSSLMQVSS